MGPTHYVVNLCLFKTPLIDEKVQPMINHQIYLTFQSCPQNIFFLILRLALLGRKLITITILFMAHLMIEFSVLFFFSYPGLRFGGSFKALLFA